MDMTSGTATDRQSAESSTKQADPSARDNDNAANAAAEAVIRAGVGVSDDPRPAAQSQIRGESLAADDEDELESARPNPPPANAPATHDRTIDGGSGSVADVPATSPITGERQGAQVTGALDDILPAGQRVVLILVGLVASGKSTFAQALEWHFPRFRRCSQDELGDRRSVEALARESLRAGLSVVIDRANFDESQRATWIRIANEFRGVQVWVIVFDTPYEVCAERLRNRTDHPTITTPELGLEVLERFQAQFHAPLPHEGYSRILHLTPADLPPTPVLSAEDVHDVLRRLRATPEIARPDPPPHRGGYGGYGWRGGPGYSRGYQPPNRGFASRGGPTYRGEWAPRGGHRDGYREGTPPRARGSGGFNAPDGGGFSSGWRGRSAPSGGSSRNVSDHDRTERDWRR